MKHIVLYLILTVIYLLFPFSISANTVFFEDFSQGLNNWQEVSNVAWDDPKQTCLNEGEKANWHISNDMAGMIINAGPSCHTELEPVNFIYPSDNFELEFDWYLPELIRMDRNFCLWWQDADNFYCLKLLDHDVTIQKIINGQMAYPANNFGRFGFQPNQIYHFKIKSLNQLIQVWINDHLVIEMLDQPPFLTGEKTLALRASSGSIKRSVSYFDNIKISVLNIADFNQLPITLIKQTNPDWQNHEYDQAIKWSDQPTIGRWGCALTSAVMLLDYYQINQLPTGQIINPTKLNAWLNNQPDGYVYPGLVNWLAISRLSQLMSTTLETPVLEYLPITSKPLLAAQEQLDHNQPVILNIPGHFVVGAGYENDDIWIKDPYFDYEWLSQHEAELKSIRAFTPSHTDLSYLILAHSPEITAQILTDESVEITNEYLQNQELTSPTMIIHSLAKPTNETYQVLVNSPTNSQLTIWKYDQTGEVIDLSIQVKGESLFEIDIINHQVTKIQPPASPFPSASPSSAPDLISTINDLYQTKEIKVKYVEIKLVELVENLKKQQASLTDLMAAIYHYRHFITEQSFRQLLNLISASFE